MFLNVISGFYHDHNHLFGWVFYAFSDFAHWKSHIWVFSQKLQSLTITASSFMSVTFLWSFSHQLLFDLRFFMEAVNHWICNQQTIYLQKFSILWSWAFCRSRWAAGSAVLRCLFLHSHYFILLFVTISCFNCLLVVFKVHWQYIVHVTSLHTYDHSNCGHLNVFILLCVNLIPNCSFRYKHLMFGIFWLYHFGHALVCSCIPQMATSWGCGNTAQAVETKNIVLLLFILVISGFRFAETFIRYMWSTSHSHVDSIVNTHLQTRFWYRVSWFLLDNKLSSMWRFGWIYV